MSYSRTTYSSLFSKIGTTWGAGDGNTTFNVPNFNNRYLKGGTAGTYGDQTLPNITGYLGAMMRWDDYNTQSGALSATNDGSHFPSALAQRAHDATIHFNASSSNGIYGRSGDVNPYNAQTVFCIRY